MSGLFHIPEPEGFAGRELFVDGFAGGGGASEGCRQALGRSPDYAYNHDADALGMHEANHPETRHVLRNINLVDPADEVRGLPVGGAWFSPDCKHHSKAKGAKPVSRNVRDLAWVVLTWIKRARPRVIWMENVEEFQDWGPLIVRDGKEFPNPERKGETFRKFIGKIRGAGYRVEWRELRACDYGAPTIRKRFYLIARCDGRPLVWPKATHGAPDDPDVVAGRKKPWRTAAEIIDWSLPCPSIFMTREEARAYHEATGIRVNRPLAEATMARIARGVMRFVIESANPFIIPVTHAGDLRVNSIDEPLRTQTTAHRGEHALVTPFILRFTQNGLGQDVREPVDTVMAGAPKFGLVTPFLVPRYGEREGQEPRTRSVEEPLPTPVPTGNEGSLVAAFIAQHNTGATGHGVDGPTTTFTARGTNQQLVTAFLAQHNTDMVGHDARKPVSTIVNKGCTQAVVAAHLVKEPFAYGSNGSRPASDPGGHPPRRSGRDGLEAQVHEPARTAQASAAEAGGVHAEERISGRGDVVRGQAISSACAPAHMDGPPGTDSGGLGYQSHQRSEGAQPSGQPGAGDPLGEPQTRLRDGSTQTGDQAHPGRDSAGSAEAPGGRFELLPDSDAPEGLSDDSFSRAKLVAAFLVHYYGTGGQWQGPRAPLNTITTKDRAALVTVTIDGQKYVIIDIGMRMLTPRERFRAQGFPDDYIIDRRADGTPLSLTAQGRMCGNSVCPAVARALIAANSPDMAIEERAAA